MGGRSSDCSSGEEDGDAEWKAAISSIAAASSSSPYACVSSLINGFSAASNHSTTPQNTHNDDDDDSGGDSGGGLYKQKPKQLKHYQLKVSGFRAKRFVLVYSFFIKSTLCGR